MATFKERFKLLKTEKNVSLQEISESVHISTSSLSKVANGKMALKHDLIETLSKYFGVTKSYLIGESEYRYNEYTISEDYIKICEMAAEMNISPKILKKFLYFYKDVSN